MRRWHWLKFVALLWLLAGLAGGIALIAANGLVPMTEGDCPQPPGSPPRQCLMWGHPHVLLGLGVIVAGILGFAALWWAGDERQSAV